MTFEITVEKLDEALVAEKHGAKRVEVCSALELGGLTPSIGLVKACLDHLRETEVHALIRTRPGNFVYTKDEVLIMLSDIQSFADLGVNGVVIGFLNSDGTLDFEVTQAISKFSKKLGLEVTFHRAIDYCTNLEEAIDELIEIGVDRILTSGQADSADQGIKMIKKICSWSDGKVEIMVGSGVNLLNAKKIYALDIDALHFSIRASQEEDHLGMGQSSKVDEDKLKSILEQFET